MPRCDVPGARADLLVPVRGASGTMGEDEDLRAIVRTLEKAAEAHAELVKAVQRDLASGKISEQLMADYSTEVQPKGKAVAA